MQKFLQPFGAERGDEGNHDVIVGPFKNKTSLLMNSIIRKFTAGAVVAGVLASSALAAHPVGYVDFGSFDADVGEQYVEVDINKALLKLASVFAQHEDPEVAELISNLERIRVNVFGVDDNNRAATTARIEAVRGQLDAQGWSRIVTVRENSGDNVAVFLKQDGEEAIQGVVVTVIGGNGEAVLVNIVGDVRLEQIARIGERLNIDPLRELKLKRAES